MPMLFAQPADTMHGHSFYSPPMTTTTSSSSSSSAPSATTQLSNPTTRPAQNLNQAAGKGAALRPAIRGIVCDCANPPYDELGCLACFEKGLVAIEHPEMSDLVPSVSPASVEAQVAGGRRASLPDGAKGVFCTCKNSEYDELGCDSCIERAFDAMAH